MAGGRLVSGRTLSGCRLVAEGGTCLVLRETRGLETIRLGPVPAIWDGRFVIGGARGATVGALGASSWAEAVARAPGLRETAIPYPARLSLPAIRDHKGLAAIPVLGFVRSPGQGRKKAAKARFLPARTLAPAVYAASPARRVALEGGASAVV